MKGNDETLHPLAWNPKRSGMVKLGAHSSMAMRFPACLTPTVYSSIAERQDPQDQPPCPICGPESVSRSPACPRGWVILWRRQEGWQWVKLWRVKECLPSNVTPALFLSLEASFWERKHVLWWRNVCKVQEFLPILLRIHFLQLESSKIKFTKKNRHMAWSHFYESISISPICKNA